MTQVEVIVHPDADSLAAAVAARLITKVIDAQAARESASVVLTGGGMGTRSQSAVLACPASAAVDWSAVDFFWGDERFLPSGHPDRNQTQAQEAFLSPIGAMADRIHAMPASDGRWGDDVEAAAAGHAEELAILAGVGARVPRFDVLMLGVGPDAHVASLFPGFPQTRVTSATVVPVTGSPKPPPVRISYSFPAIAAAEEVWLVAAGAEKAAALAEALAPGADPTRFPAAGARGRRRILALIDRSAATGLAH
ncbi:MAG: 6-phosphogluconolactonase [Candidatus Nanopelagicales bacterium]|nr:6-phosphogluconolactonase [Candidatus Nanopelagicales bacterium]MDZ4250609.1 6-phosphogluconolactonase [Candidatus Nanopelagicales bacterium]